MSKKITKILKHGSENERLIVSERRPGESESDQNRRIEEFIKVFAQKPAKSDKNKLDALLDTAMTAIEKWKKECLSQGKNPSCISSFRCVDRKTKYPSQSKYMIFGEQPETIVLLKYINKKLDTKEEFYVEEIPEKDEDGVEIIPIKKELFSKD